MGDESINEELRRRLAAIEETLKAQNDTYRRDREEMVGRMDGHGKRLTIMETTWAAFFGELGAFKTIIRDIKECKTVSERVINRVNKIEIRMAALVAIIMTLFKVAEHLWK